MAGDDTPAGLQTVFQPPTAPDGARGLGAPAVEQRTNSTMNQPVEALPTAPLDRAIRENWLEMWYQPKIDLRQKSLAGAEAFVRMRHPESGGLLPASFPPQGDEDSLLKLTQRALVTTLHDWQTLDEAGFNLRLAINVPVDLLPKLPISAIVNENRPKAEHWPGLIVEVTEDQIVRDIKRTRDVAGRLRVDGITIAIDDFGAGYSSFGSLRELAFAELKINRGFVRNCAIDATNAAICQTAIDLAHRFGSAAVAAGIESMADLQTLQVMGCDFGQGALLSAPMPLPEFLSLLQQRMNRARTPQAVSSAA